MSEQYIIYLRKSRADGEHETVEDVLARHEKILQDFSMMTFGYKILEENIYREVVSGETITDRPLIKQVLRRIENEEISGVLVVEPQRLSRGDLRDCGTIIRAFQYTETIVITPHKNYNLSEKYDRKFFEMELMRGNDYLEYTKEILMRGRIASISEGNFIGSIPPYGYSKVKIDKCHTLAENSESEVVKLIYDLFVNQKLGTTKIADYLDKIGAKPRNLEQWSAASIREILLNPVYTGKIRWNWRKKVKKYKDGEIIISRPKSSADSWMLIDGKHNAIITDEMFQAAQTRFGQNARVTQRHEIVNPFAGLVKCQCGKAMVYKKSDKSAPRLLCNNQTKCKNKSVTFADFETEVIKALRQSIANFKVKVSNNANTVITTQENIIENLNKELNTVENQQEKLYELLEQGIYTNEVFLKRNIVLSHKREKIKSDIQTAQASIPEVINYDEKIVQLSEAIQTITSSDISIKSKNEFLKTVIEKIEYSSSRTPRRAEAFQIKVFFKL